MEAAPLIEALVALTTTMADAAHRQDFDQLATLAGEYQALSDELLAHAPTLPVSLRQQVRTILDNQARIVAQTSPWHTSVRKLLQDNRREQALIDAYGAPP